MRGRAAEISDPSPFGWEVLWEALKTELPGDEPSTLTQELGLDQEREITSGYGGPSWYATEFSGTRHGRRVALRMGVIPRIRGNGYNEVHVKAPVAPFRLRVTDGRPAVQEGSSPDVEQLVASLAPAPEVWRKLEVDGGPDGILARRPVTAASPGIPLRPVAHRAHRRPTRRLSDDRRRRALELDRDQPAARGATIAAATRRADVQGMSSRLI
jgi:hypothetical protein